VKELTDSTFDEFISSGFVVVDFYATWCSPCSRLGVALERLQLKFSNIKFGKVDVEESANISITFDVMSVPTLILFKDGKKVDKIEGLLPEKKLIERLEAFRTS
jgi:thioredoxin 1